jgi:hypothetical protein
MFDEVEEQVSSAERASRRWVLIVVALNVAIVGLVLLLWNLRPRGPAWVVYDLASSRAATLHDYFCAPEIRAACQKEVLDGEAGFRHALLQAFDEVPECRGVGFIIDEGSEGNTSETAGLLSMAKKRGYWRLKVDYHVGAAGQSFDLRPGTDKPTDRAVFGGEADARQMMSSVCDIARHNGPRIYW